MNAVLPLLLVPLTLEAPRDSVDELLDEVRGLVQTAAADGEFSGSVAIARDGEVLLTLAVGEASKRFGVPNTVDTRFNLGSMNKMFTAVAVMQLVEEGLVALEDPISKYVDESWLPRAITDRATVFHLLTHGSGLGSYFNETYMRSSRDLFRAVDDYKPLVQGDQLAFEPGTRFAYSNTGMLLLGVVIESASGTDYFERIRSHVYAPAGMERTDCYEMDRPVPDLAIGYEPDPEHPTGWRNNLYLHVLKGGPAGGGFSTAPDLLRFARALVEGELLSVSSLDQLWTDHLGAGYGFGFRVLETPAGKVVGHGGGFPGISANLDVFLDQGLAVAVMSNHGGVAHDLAQDIRALVERLGA